MNTMTTSKKLAIAALLAALGFVGNYLALPVAYSVAFIFGSIFSIIAIGLLGPWWGVGVAIVASSYTVILWNHPYALIIFTLEALWIGIALRRSKSNLVLIDAFFWLVAGSLLVTLFYGGTMGLNTQSVLIIFLKQAINGLFNALIASILLDHTPIARLTENKTAHVTYKKLIFNVVCAFLMFPTLSLLLYENYRENSTLNEQAATRVQAETSAIGKDVADWLQSHLKAIEIIAGLGGTHRLVPSSSLQEELERINKLFPDFHNVYLGNGSGTTVAFYPPKNERGVSTIGLNFADRPYFKQLTETGKPVISDVFSGRGGVFKPIFTISSPVMKDGRLSHFALGAINLDRLRENLKNHAQKGDLVITLLDSKRNIVVSSDTARKSLDKLQEVKGSDIITAVPDVFLRVPGTKKNAGVMQVWKKAYYFSSLPVTGTGWTLQVEYPLAPMQKLLYTSAINGLGAVALLFVPMIGIAFAFSRYLTRPLESLATISANLPSRIYENEEIVWPESNIAEVAVIVDNFQMTSEALGSKIGSLNNRLSLAADSAKIGVWEYLVPENQLIWDKWMFALYGIREEDFLGAYEAWQNGLHPDDKAPGDVAINQALRGEKDFDIEFRVVWPTGEVRHIKANALVQRDADGKPLRMIGVNYDITKRKQAEEAQNIHTGLITSLLDSIPDIIFYKDKDGVYLGCNPPFAEFVGKPKEDIIGKTDYDLFGKEIGDFFRDNDNEMLKQLKSRNNEEWITYPDGRKKLIDTLKTPYWSADAELIGLLGISRDITERKQAEEALFDAMKQAESANKAKSEFLATMSHEIRTPMNGVIGMAGLLLDTELTAEQREFADIVRKSGENLLSLINDILDFSKIEAGKLDIEMLDFDLRTTLEDTAEMLSIRAGDAGLELICRIDPAVPQYLRGDPGRIRQIITNLAGNSIKFTHEGEVVISAALESTPPPDLPPLEGGANSPTQRGRVGEGVESQSDNVVIRFEVRDTGIGIPQHRLAAIFDPFTQVDGSTTRKYGGTGLGLAICKQLTELMGGEIGIDSEEGKGSTFWFTARFEKPACVETQAFASLPHADIAGTKVLVVDDNATSRMLLITLLNSWGCRYETAAEGETALTLLREAAHANEPFRIALLDQQMPGMTGSELGSIIKGDPQIKSTILVMVTSLGRRGDVGALEKIGFAGYLAKPVRQSQMKECLEIVLGRENQPSEVFKTSKVSVHARGIVTRHTVAEAANRGVRILLAEDNVINQKVAQSILNKLGYKADVVANGLETVKALELINYDLVLMDCQMPEMDGFEATVVIRDAGSKVLNHNVPIIAMTANAIKGDRETCIEAGMDDYLSKPVKKDELNLILDKWLTPGDSKDRSAQKAGDTFSRIVDKVGECHYGGQKE